MPSLEQESNGNGTVMPNQYETIYEAQEGTSLVLTLDIYIQHILEDVLSRALEDTRAENVYGIVMEVDTGAILGMVSLPDYDLNDPFTISSEDLLSDYEEISAMSVEELTENDIPQEQTNKSYYRNVQWSNRAIVNTYEPGSVFKIITAAASIEEGLSDTTREFYCGGSIDYATRHINCWRTSGHGSETFYDLLKNSCNPFAVTLADAATGLTFANSSALTTRWLRFRQRPASPWRRTRHTAPSPRAAISPSWPRSSRGIPTRR